MTVSEPRSRIPPRTFSLRPLMSELTAMTVVMPMTMPRTVSAERSGFLRSVSSARAICSFSSSARAGLTMSRNVFARGLLKVCATVDMEKLSVFSFKQNEKQKFEKLAVSADLKGGGGGGGGGV